MPLLVVSPNWPSSSELWMERMNETLGDRLGMHASWGSRPARTNETDSSENAVGRLETTGVVQFYELNAVAFDRARRLGVAPVARRFGFNPLRRLLERPECECVVCHYANLAVLLAPLWKQCHQPLLVHVHGYDITWDYRMPHFPWLRRFSTRYPEQVVDLAKRAWFLANSKFTASRLIRAGVPADRVLLKYLGVPVNEKPPIRNHAYEPVILYLGRLVDFKGPLETIEAFELACRHGLKGQLIIAGDGPLRRACQRKADRSPFKSRIQLVGSVTATQGQQLRESSDIFTAHNRLGPTTRQEEAYGVAFLEAMAAGLPVVTGRSGGVSETVVDGSTGFLFSPGDITAHAEALLQLALSPKQRWQMGDAGHRRASEMFSQAAERQAWNSIFTEIGRPDWVRL
jgi:colanic acid/amylovoran biosynthesis glycosyltransferase